MLDGAVREVADGILVDVDVRTDARETKVTGINVWRRALSVDVAAVPRRGEANRTLEAFFGKLGGRGSSAQVVRGVTARRKTVLVRGVSLKRLVEALEQRVP